MKTKLFNKFASMILAICMVIGVAIPAYAMELPNSTTEAELYETEDSGVATQSSVPEVHLGYTEAKDLFYNQLVDQKSYKLMGRIYLPNDPHINRIIYTAFFKKDDSDTGIGDVKLNLQFRRNGEVIYNDSFEYMKTAGMLLRKEVKGVHMNEVIEVWADASSVSQSNGSIRKILITNMGVYTD